MMTPSNHNTFTLPSNTSALSFGLYVARVICPPGYSVTDTNCFRWFDQAATWLDARAACQKDGGDLAVITDDNTQVYVQGTKHN